MLIAKKKRKKNIAEYILYLYQIENLIRAFNLDIDLIERELVSKYKADDNTKNEILNWYKNLVLMMEKEGITQSGHLQFLTNLIDDVYEVHLKLMDSETDALYTQNFKAIAGLITELKQKNKQADNDVQVSLDAIYGYLLLKMQNKAVTDETKEAVKRLSNWLGLLSGMFKKYESGELFSD